MKIPIFLKKIVLLILASFGEIVLRLKKVEIIEAKTDEEKTIVYKLRYEIYKQYGHIEAEDFPDRELRDKDDARSISILALKRGKPVGTVRLILGDKKEDFPTFRMWNIDFSKFSVLSSQIGELSKLGVIRTEKRKSWIWLGMMKRVFKKSRELNHRYWIFNTSNKIVDSTKKKFNTPVSRIPTLEDTPYNLEERKEIKGFLKRYEIFPYFVDLKKIGTL